MAFGLVSKEAALRGWIVIGLGVLALAGTVRAQEAELLPGTRPGIHQWSTGSGLYMYHQLKADCVTLEHGHGRNAVRGLWRMPLSEILEDGPEENPAGGAILRFRCADGSACIQSGAYRSTPDRTQAHGIPFETMDGARRFAVEVANLKVACNLTP
jgi:hypothetical protein